MAEHQPSVPRGVWPQPEQSGIRGVRLSWPERSRGQPDQSSVRGVRLSWPERSRGQPDQSGICLQPDRARIFLLSPANCNGKRAQLVVSPRAEFPLARMMRGEAGAPLGELFSFVSGLYFRGKLAYARRFARPPDPVDPVTAGGVLVITPNAGLRSADASITATSFRAFAETSIEPGNAAYRKPMEQAARAVLDAAGPDCEVVLLGSIASPKYVDLLLPVFGERLVFPPAFVGRGDMSRGGLMLRCVDAGTELEYTPVAGAVRHGPRPPKLQPLRRQDRTG